MLYKFKTRNAGDVIMLEPHGRRLLEIIGKEPGAKGIILSEDMPAAQSAARAAIVQEEEQLAQQQADYEAGKGPPPVRGDNVSLRQRAQPFLELLKSAHAQGDPVVWGV